MSKIFKSQNQKTQLHEAIKKVVPNFKSYKCVYTTADHGYDDETIWAKCKNHTISLLLVKSSDYHKGK